ncbi:MAG: fused MFS/spermidine synthase [Caldilineaceae bacterium]
MATNSLTLQSPISNLSLLVFTTGFVTLGVELSASRLLEPAFGSNQLVWAALIGMILLYLSVGAWLGGWLADRYPQRRALDLTLTLAAIGVALIPTLSRPILRLAATGIEQFAPGLLIGALLAIALLFCLPVILLGTATPWAVRLSVANLQATGSVAGRLSALATVGSLFGAFVPVLWLIPLYGTRWTFFLLALVLMAVLIVSGLRQRHLVLMVGAVLLIGVLAAWTESTGSIRAAWDDGSNGQIIYEDESQYNYIAVRQWHSERHLKLNDGTGIHSVYHPESVLAEGIWDYFLLAPFFRQEDKKTRREEVEENLPISNLLIIGSAAGTVSELYTNIYGSIPITGIELDPQIIEVGQQFFGMTQPNLTAVAADGRQWLTRQAANARWDVIAIDAYRPPYIPFHLTTVEFFELVRSHLSEQGVLAINVGRTARNYELVDALVATVGQVFPAVYVIDEPGPADNLGNSMVYATLQPVTVDEVKTLVKSQPTTLPVEFRNFASEAVTRLRSAIVPAEKLVFTDDRAPVEMVIHRIILDFIFGG